MKIHWHALLALGLLCAGCSTADDSEPGRFNGLFYEVKGSGKPVILIHGGQVDRRMWDYQWEALPPGARFVRYDIRGFGKSEAPLKPYSDRGDLRELLQHLRIFLYGSNQAQSQGQPEAHIAFG